MASGQCRVVRESRQAQARVKGESTPSDTFPNRSDALCHEACVIAVELLPMGVCLVQQQREAVAVDMVCPFKTTGPETAKQVGFKQRALVHTMRVIRPDRDRIPTL